MKINGVETQPDQLTQIRREIEGLKAEVGRLQSRNSLLKSGLIQCADWFEEYADIHAAKGNELKSVTNRRRANNTRALARDEGEAR